MTAPRMSLADWALLILLSLLWGGAYFFNGVAVQELGTFSIVAARVGGGAVTLWLILRLLRISMPRDPALWRAFFVMGLLNNVIPFSSIVWGQGHIASGLASILNATTPLFTVLVAHGLTADEKMSPAKILGVLTGFGYICYFRLIDRAGATNASLVTMLIPASALILGATILGEVIEPAHLAGMALIFLGLAILDGRAWARVRRRSSSGRR